MLNALAQLHTASAPRSVAAARVMNSVQTPVNFYFGYWFSHWRA
jgi:hypothetical protein